MKKRKREIILCFIIIVLILCININIVLVAYASEQTNIFNSEELSVPVEELDLGDYRREMIVGETQLLNITVIPIEADDQTLSYASSDLEVARVNGIGRISAMAEGSTTITVSCGDISESFNLEVSSITEEPDTTIAVTDIELQDFNDELHVGETITLSPTVFPIDATDQSITYKSSDAAIATISPSGIIEGISSGKVTIYISAGDYTKEVPLNVKVKTSGIKVNRDYILLKPGKVFTLESRVVPSNASAKIIKYKSLDTQIATVSKNGLIEAIDNGYTSIIVSNDEISTVVTVIVDQHAQAENVPVDNDSSQEAIKIVYPHKVGADEFEYINENMLKYFYENEEYLTIEGDKYTIKINGSDIVNYSNEFYTMIDFKEEPEGISFELNQRKNLCGTINLIIHDIELGNHLYLYNDAKDKYYLIQTKDISRLTLDTPGKYIITMDKLTGFNIRLWVVICVFIIFIGLVTVYIVVKKRHWFW